jgi:hypothetical protein
MIIFGPSEIVRLGWGIFGVGEFVVILVLLQSVYHIRRAVLGARSERPDEDVSQSQSSDARRSLPPRPFSVTEGTTELIDPTQAPVAAPSSRDTDSI